MELNQPVATPATQPATTGKKLLLLAVVGWLLLGVSLIFIASIPPSAKALTPPTTARVAGEVNVTGETVMNATISAWISIVPSEALSQGIQFGTITPDSLDNNATNNTNGPDNGTNYSFTVDELTLVRVDFYNRAGSHLNLSGSPTIVLDIGNVTHKANITSNNESVIDPTDSINLTLGFLKLGNGSCDNLVAGNVCWMAYWVDIPLGQPVGEYNTTYYFCATQRNTLNCV